MNELIERLLSEVRSALRFRWYGLAAAWLVCVVGWGVVVWLPDVYESDATVYVDTSSALQPLLGKQIVAPDVDAQIAYVRQNLLGRPELDTVIRKFNLDKDVNSAAERQKLVAEVRERIHIEKQNTNGRRSSDSVYTISYRNVDREKAVGVVRTLLAAFIGDTIGADRSGNRTTQQFLDERINEYEHRLRDAEQALADFKKKHADNLPGSEGDYFSQMQKEKEALGAAQKNLRVLEAKRSQLLQQLRGAAPATADSDTGPDGKGPPEDSIEARIRKYQAQLDTALLTYTDRHPDVIALKQTIKRLKQQRAQQLREQAASGDAGTAQSDNPVTQATQIALNQTKVDIAAAQADIADRQAKVKHLQSMIDEVPEVEAQLAQLNRDYNVVHQQYLDLVKSRETQQLTEKASAADKTHFRVIDPPVVPANPVAPRRLLLLAGVFVLALGIGGGVSWLAGQLWPVFGSARILRQRVQMPVLGTIAHAWQDRHRRERRRAVLAFAGSLGMMFVVLVAVAAVEKFGHGVHGLTGWLM